MTLQEIKDKIISTIDANRADILDIGERSLKIPEMGYREEQTSALVREEFDKLGLAYEYPLALTGVKAGVVGRDTQSNVCIIGEMDALKCAGSPIANAQDVAHACGHNAQVAAMLGAAIGLVKSGVMEELDGKVTFMAVPAEEFIDMDYADS